MVSVESRAIFQPAVHGDNLTGQIGKDKTMIAWEFLFALKGYLKLKRMLKPAAEMLHEENSGVSRPWANAEAGLGP